MYIYKNIYIYTGDDSGDLLATLCSNVSAGSLFVSSNNFYLVFESDQSRSGFGFEIEYMVSSKYLMYDTVQDNYDIDQSKGK